ncbi:uncharacterized protein LOC135848221 [Planococcus citri]|uniref:uncharacterized protein LOC135848221 n=1 Tax=Planococcus citri TaxID=170843 RepID=UPI0031F9B6E9
MPVGSWEVTTKFLFNYTPITRNVDVFKGMIRADTYIRLYSKKNNKPLTLYSGTHQRQIEETKTSCIYQTCKSTVIDSFWRIIIDDNSKAVMLVTQHTLKKCNPELFLCEKNLKVKTYKKGGCIYTCSLDGTDQQLKGLDLPPLRTTGYLDLTFQKINSSESQMSEPTEPPEETDIMDFLNNPFIRDAIKNVDGYIGNNVKIQYAPIEPARSWWPGGGRRSSGGGRYSGGGSSGTSFITTAAVAAGGGGGGDI